MTFASGESIQPGWTVYASDGEELGTVTAVDQSMIHVKKGGLLGDSLDVPRSDVDEIETGRVELGVTKAELKGGNR